MASNRIDVVTSQVQVEVTRPRQTERPATPFRDLLAGSVNVLMSGAEAVAGVVGGPVLSLPVRETRANVVEGLRGGPSAEVAAAGGGGGGIGAAAPTDAPLSRMETVEALQRDSQMFNLQFLALQEEIQQESRRFTTLSNVMRARHDTAKNAIGNIRS